MMGKKYGFKKLQKEKNQQIIVDFLKDQIWTLIPSPYLGHFLLD